MPAVDELKSLNRNDQVVLGCGVLGLIFSFFGFVGKSFGPITYTESAWNGLGLLAMLLLLVGTVVAGARVFAAASLPKMAIGVNVLTLGLVGLGTLLLLIHGFTAGRDGVHLGLRVMGVLTLLLFIAETGAAFLLFRESGEAVPDFKAMGNRSSAPVAPPAYGNTPPPPVTYPATPATPAGDYTLDDQPPAPTV
jgi:hypothetical protein